VSSLLDRLASLNLYRLASFSRRRQLRVNRSLSRMLTKAPIHDGFFESYPEFFSTSMTAASRNRLNLRHRALIEANETIIRGRSVLDIASHDGRWSFAALKAGARHVVGIEPRQHLVDFCHRHMARNGVPRHQFNFICGDVFNEIDDLERDSIETVFASVFFTTRCSICYYLKKSRGFGHAILLWTRKSHRTTTS